MGQFHRDSQGRHDQAAEKIQQALTQIPNFRNLKDHVEITITADGLRIELLETEAGMFFESGKPCPPKAAAELLSTLAEELGKLPNNMLIEGHTDSKPFQRRRLLPTGNSPPTAPIPRAN